MSCLSVRHSGMAGVNERPQLYLPLTHLSTSEMSHACFYSQLHMTSYQSSTPWAIKKEPTYYGHPMKYGRPLYFRPVVSSFFLSSFFAYSQPSHIECLLYFHTWCGLSANLGMKVWNVLHTARWKYRTQKLPKNLPSGHNCTTLSGWIFATKAYIDNRKKYVKQQYILHMSSQYGKLRPTNSCDWFRSFRHPSKFQRVSRLAFITAARSLTGGQPNFAWCFGRLLGCYTYTFLGALAP